MEIGSKAIVFYSDDTVWHERIILLPSQGANIYWILTPDDDVYEEDLGGRAADGPSRVREVPEGVRTLPNLRVAVYRFRMELTEAILRDKVREALRGYEESYGPHPRHASLRVRLPGGEQRMLMDWLPRRRITRQWAAEASGAAEVPAIALEPDAEAWVVIYASDGNGMGEQVTPPAAAQLVKVGGRAYKLFARENEVVMVQGTKAEQAPDVSRLARGSGKAQGSEEKDVRVLSVMFDTADERWRSLQEAVPDYLEVDFDDFPLQGPRTVFRDARQLRRLGFDWLQHHESWLKKSGVRLTDRSVHEHSALCRVLNLMTSYDQLNLPSLASAEALNRRRTLIEVAHQGRPEAPSYEGAEEILGVRESADGSVIDPALTRHAARRQADRAEVLKQNRLAAEERRHALSRGDGGEKPDKPFKKGDGKGDKGDKTKSTP